MEASTTNTIPRAPKAPQRPRGHTLLWGLAWLALLLVAAEGTQAWAAWRATHASGPFGAVPAGTLCSVQLVNGQVYYGEFVGATPSHVRLRHVYYVQTLAAAPGGTPANRLVNRHKTDWHAPDWMDVPADKVLMLEAVGPDSRLAQLIGQDRAPAAPPR